MSSNAKSRVLLIGGGGVGAMAAYALETGGRAEVTAILRSNYDAVRKTGFSIDSVDHGNAIKGFRPTHVRSEVPDVEKDGLAPFEFIIVCTKNVPDVPPTVVELIESAVTPEASTIVLLQNGLNIEKPIIGKFPENVILSGISFISASERSHGLISQEDRDWAKLGPFTGQKVANDRAERATHKLLDVYNACGKVKWELDEDVAFSRWRKLVYNSSFNSVSAILNMGVIRMRMTQHVIDDLIKPVMLEIQATAKAAGVHLPDDVIDFFIHLDPTDHDFMPSMGQDASKGNYMEIETIVGEPVREARRLDVPVPTLQTIYGLLRGLQMEIKAKKGEWRAEFQPGNPYA